MRCGVLKRALFATFFVVLAATSDTAAASPDADFVAGLTERRLFPLAEKFLRARLGEQNLTSDERVDLTIALARTCAEHALHSPRSQRQPLWQAADQAAEDLRAAIPEHPQIVLVDMQQALTVLARGEIARQESEVGASGAPSLDEARRELQHAITQLRGVGETVENQLRSVGDADDDALGESELLSLQRNVDYQTARALRNQALCYAPKSAERSDALIRALELLGPLAKLDPLDHLVWKARLDEASCLRLAGRSSEASARLDALGAARPPSTIALDARAERARLALDRDDPQAALAALRLGRELAGRTSAELDLAHVETFVALWRAATKSQAADDARQWQERAAAMVRAIESLYGPYWTRRAELLVASSAGDSGTENVDVLIRAAKNFYLRQEFDEAVDAYQRAAQGAATSDRAKALDLHLAAALIERRRNRLAQAMRLQQAASLALHDTPKAPTLHLQAVVDAAQLARDGQAATLEHYRSLLREHIDTWPVDATSDQARAWLGRLYEHEEQLQAALAVYQSTSPSNAEHYVAAIDGAARVQTALLEQLRSAEKLTDADVAAAITFFEAISTATDETPPVPSKARRQAALYAARLRLQFTSSGFAQAQELLSTALAEAPPEDEQWKSQAQSLLVVAQAGTGDRTAAADTLRQLSGGSAGREMEMLRGLHAIGAGAQPAVAREIAALELEVVARLEQSASKLSDHERKSLELIAARALALSGQQREARDKLAVLSRAHPDDGEVQWRYAELLSAAPDRASQFAARDAWRNVLRRTPANTSKWFEAKLAVAQAHYALGQWSDAAQMIEVLRTVQPELGGPAMKTKFLELLAKCKK